MKRKKRKLSLTNVIIGSLLFLLALLCVFPIINIVAISFSESAAAVAGRVVFLPVKPTVASYTKIIAEGTFFRAFYISAIRVVLGTSLGMLILILTAYPLSKGVDQFRFRNVFMWIVIATMLFSGGLIPTFIMVKNYGLIDSIWALILPMLMSSYNAILLMNFFKGIPRQLDEAASIDGANAWYIAFRIYVPLSLPALATIGLFTILGHWNDYFLGLIYINKPENYPLQTYIRSLMLKMDFATMTPDQIIERAKVGNQTFNAAKIVVSMIPILCIYPFLQRFFVHGLVMGAMKE